MSRARVSLHIAFPRARNGARVGEAKTGSSSTGAASSTASPTATPIGRAPLPIDGCEKTPNGRFANPKSDPAGTGGQRSKAFTRRRNDSCQEAESGRLLPWFAGAARAVGPEQQAGGRQFPAR